MNPATHACLLRLLGVLCWFIAPPAQATEIAGVRFPDTASIAGQTVALNGAALRSWASLRIYAIGLYLPEHNGAAADILARPGPKRISLALLRDTTSRELSDALNGDQKGETIEGDDFHPALLRIWLGDRPPQASVKEALLGRAR